jgi:hypothetical protein
VSEWSGFPPHELAARLRERAQDLRRSTPSPPIIATDLLLDEAADLILHLNDRRTP